MNYVRNHSFSLKIKKKAPLNWFGKKKLVTFDAMLLFLGRDPKIGHHLLYSGVLDFN